MNYQELMQQAASQAAISTTSLMDLTDIYNALYHECVNTYGYDRGMELAEAVSSDLVESFKRHTGEK